MKLLNKDTDYAFRALAFIAKSKKKIVSATDLENNLKLPRPFLRKILQMLQKAGVLSSIKGNKGGFALNCDPEELVVLDVMKIFQGELSFTDCLFKQGLCHDVRKCLIRKKIKHLERIILADLGKTTLASLL